MKQKKTLVVVLVVFVLLLASAYLLYNGLIRDTDTDQLAPQPQQPTDTTGQEQQAVQAPDFTVYDADGNPVHLSQFVGKPIVLNFWASWCGPCKREMPEFQEVFTELDGQVQFLMVNATGGRETVATAKAFIQQSGYTFPVFYDTEGQASYTYGATSLPTTFFIDAQGHVVTYAVGAINKTTLMKGIDMITE